MPAPATPAPARTAQAILVAWLVAGTADILGAHVHYFARGGRNPLAVLNFVASGALGPSAHQGGTGTAALGLLFHYIIAFAFTLAFFLAYPRAPLLRKNLAATAVGYGLFAWAFMSFVVLPFARTPKGPFNPAQAAIGAGILVVCIGLPLALLARRHYGARAAAATA